MSYETPNSRMPAVHSVVRTSLLTTPRVLSGALLILCALYFTLLSSSTLHNAALYYAAPQPRPSNLSQNLPDIIIFGVRKGGTRALLEFLSMHPKLVTARNELHFFDRADIYALGMEWYRSQMPWSEPGQLTVEKTPGYFITSSAPRKIKEMNPNIKLILIVRDPVIRTISDYVQIKYGRLLNKLPCDSFEEMVIDPVTENINLDYKAVQISMYHKHYKKWIQTFDTSQIHIVDGDNMIKKPYEELAKVETFLNLKHVLTQDRFYFNKTKGFYCMHKNATTEKCLGSSKGRSHPKIDPAVLQKLKKFYIPHNYRFYNMTGRNFHWPIK